MKVFCRAPVHSASRVLDLARCLGLELDDFRLTRAGPDRAALEVRLSDPACHAASIFHARLTKLVDIEPEITDA